MNIKLVDFKGKPNFQCNWESITKDIQNTEDLFNKINKDNNNNFFELLTPETKIKPYYDIDAKFEDDRIEVIEDDIKIKVLDKLNSLYPKNTFISICSSHGKKYDKDNKLWYALSFHMVINGYETNLIDLHKFNELNDLYNEDNGLYIDKSVYKSRQLIRLIYSYKPNDNRQKKPINCKRNLLKHIIHSNKDTNNNFLKINIPSPAITPPLSPKVENKIKEEFNKNFNIPKLKEEEFKKLLFSIKPRYEYKDWISIGHICFNNFDGSDIGFKIFNEYSEKDKKKYSGIEKLLNTYNYFKKQNPENRLSYKQLKRWYDIDYPCKNIYEKWYNEGIDIFMSNMNKIICYYTKEDEYLYYSSFDVMIQNNLKKTKNYFIKYKFLIDYKCQLTDKMKKKHVNPFDIWNENINRRDVDYITFNPMNSDNSIDNYFNWYSGLNYINTGDYNIDNIEPFLFHIKDVISNNNLLMYEYILNWFSRMIQTPWKKNGTCLVWKSIQGTGKTLIYSIIKKIFDKYAVSTNDMSQIIGKFTTTAKNKILINFDETNWGGNVKEEGRFKNLITNDYIKIEGKGKDPDAEYPNYANNLITTNQDWMVSLKKDDRRFVLTMCKNERLSNEKYKKLKNIMDNHIQDIFNFFYNRDISNYNPEEYPKTEFYFQQLEINYDTFQVFWERLCNGEFNESLSWKTYNDKNVLYDLYTSYNHGSHKEVFNNVWFWRKVRLVCPSIVIRKSLKNSNADFYLPEIEKINEEFKKYNY